MDEYHLDKCLKYSLDLLFPSHSFEILGTEYRFLYFHSLMLEMFSLEQKYMDIF